MSEPDRTPMVTMSGNYFFTDPSKLSLRIASNYTNYVSLGVSGSEDYFLDAEVRDSEVVVNAELFDASGTHVCSVRDSFPEGENCEKKLIGNGWTILANGEELPGVQLLSEQVCLIRGRIYTRTGELVAEEKSDDFLVYRGPVVLGRSGGALGMVIQ